MRWLCASMCLGGLMAWAVSSPGAWGQEKKLKAKAAGGPTVKVGDPAPTFASVDDQGKPYKSSAVVGKKAVVIFFFPAALTGG
jgi:cytochrome oxidase Cu insertion factor (SCO1/SenC/PrrC family)